MATYQNEYLKNLQENSAAPTPTPPSTRIHNKTKPTKQKIKADADSYPINVKKILQLSEQGSTSSQPSVAPVPISLGQLTEDAPSLPEIYGQPQTQEIVTKRRKILQQLDDIGTSSSQSSNAPVMGSLGQTVENSSAPRLPEIAVQKPEAGSDQFMQIILQKLDNIERDAARKEKIDRELLEASIKNKNKLSRLEQDVSTIKTDLLEVKRNRGHRKDHILPITSEEHLNEIEEQFEDYRDDLCSLFQTTPSVSAYGLYRHFCNLMLDRLPKYNWSGRMTHNTNNPHLVPKGAEPLNIFKLLLSVGMSKYGLDEASGRKEMIRAFKAYYDAKNKRLRRLNATM